MVNKDLKGLPHENDGVKGKLATCLEVENADCGLTGRKILYFLHNKKQMLSDCFANSHL